MYKYLDVSKDTIAVAIADPGPGEPRFHGTIQNKPEDIRKLMKKLGSPENLLVRYEAGSSGYGIYRLLLSMDIECMVVAPSLIPKRSGDRVKTDKRDSIRLAQLLRAGELTSVWVPDEDHFDKKFFYGILTLLLKIVDLARRQTTGKENPHVQLCTRSKD